MRIAIGQLWQETNTLNPRPTTPADFGQFGVVRGDELVAGMENVNELGGFIQSLRQWPVPPEIAGLVRLPAWPGGMATSQTFTWIRDELLGALDAAMPVDGVLLALHGAMVADLHPDVEGEILDAFRTRIGPQVPLVATIDLHANVTGQMVRSADALVPYHCLPHIDIFETGARAADVLRRILFDGAQPCMAFAKIPAVVPAERSSTEADAGIAVDIKRRLLRLENEPRMLAAGVTPVQPWMDIPELGSSALVTTDRDPAFARQACGELAEMFWKRRREYLPELVDVAEAVRAAHATREGLVVLSDAADATTSGAPGDSVWILEELLKYEWPREALVTVVAPDVVAAASQAGAGAPLATSLGGVLDDRFGRPIEFQGVVESCFEARFTMTGHIGKNLPIDMGPAVVLRRQNVCVVVTSRSGPHFAPELFQTAGFDPFAASVVVAKSPCGFRAVYESRASAVYCVRAPGCAPSDFWTQPFANIPRPLWPWDELESWRPQPILRRREDETS